MSNAAETLFKHATELLESEVYTPIVLQKLAERGYPCETVEEAQKLLKQAQEIRQGLLTGEIAPIPMVAVGEGTEEMVKQASDAVNEDFLAHAPDITIDVTQLDPKVKEAATVACCAYMHGAKQAQEEYAV